MGFALREVDTRITMKLVYTLGGLATVLATGTQAFQLTSKNVQQLQNSLEDRVDQKYTNMKRQLRQKRALFDGVLDQLADEININDYNVAAGDCQVATAGFWKECRQCIAQQCTSYMSRQCGSDIVPAELQGSNDFTDFLSSRMAQVSPSISELEEYLEILKKAGVSANVDYQMNGEDLKMSTRNRRNADDSIDCQQFVTSKTNMEVKCVNYNDSPQPLEAEGASSFEHTTNDAIFGNWKFTVEGTHGHEMAEQGLNADGAIQIKLSVVANDGSDYGMFDNSDDGLFDAPAYQNSRDLVKVDGDYAYGELSVNENSYPMTTGENADCNQMLFNMPLEQVGKQSPLADNKPCVGDNAEAIEPESDVEDFNNLLDIDSEGLFCDSIGGCTDVPFVRRSSRDNNQRFNRAAKRAMCQDLNTMPETCTSLGFACESCDKKLSVECPEYYNLRSELSKKISDASSLAEEFQTLTKANFEQVKFLHALNVEGAKAIYV